MYKGTLIAVKDMEESKAFYRDILELRVAGGPEKGGGGKTQPHP